MKTGMSLKINTPLERWDYAFTSVGIFLFASFLLKIFKILTPIILYKISFPFYLVLKLLNFILIIVIFYIFSVSSIKRLFDILGTKKRGVIGFIIFLFVITTLIFLLPNLEQPFLYGFILFLILRKGQLIEDNNFEWNKVKIVQIIIISAYLLLTLMFNLNFTTFVARGNGMAPAIRRGDEFLVRRLKGYKLKRKDFVVYKLGIGGTYYQRIIGLPKEKIEIKRNQDNIANIYINDKILSEPYKKLKEYSPHPKAIHYGKTIIAENSYFILGDNRDMSYDSRFLGPINKSKIIGKIIYIYYPIRRVKFFK